METGNVQKSPFACNMSAIPPKKRSQHIAAMPALGLLG